MAVATGGVVSIGTVPGSAAPPPAAASTSQAERPLITVGSFRHAVSPNGDGFHDRLRIPFTVRRWASVSVRVVALDSGRTVYDGCVTSGEHTCEFGRGTYALRLAALRTGGPRPWAPGAYGVRLVARSFADVESARARTSFDLFPGTVLAVRREIAFTPNGDGLHDRARIAFTLERRARVAAFLHPLSEGAPSGQVALGVRNGGRTAWTWDGRVGGVLVPDGRYRLELRARPTVGKHRKPTTDEIAVRVRTGRSRPPA